MKRKGPEPQELTGKRFGKLVALEFFGWDIKKRRIWLLECDCGNEAIKTVNALTRKITVPVSCEICSRKDWGSLKLTHGQSVGGRKVDRIYRIWAAMKSRCTYRKFSGFGRYGGRGIRVCDEWQNFEKFRDWATSHGYTETMTIDRVNPNLHYDPSNCEWVPLAVNSWRANKPDECWRSMTTDALRVVYEM